MAYTATGTAWGGVWCAPVRLGLNISDTPRQNQYATMATQFFDGKGTRSNGNNRIGGGKA